MAESIEVGVAKLLGMRPYGENEHRDCPVFQNSLEQEHGRPAVQAEIVKQLGVRL